MHSQGRQMCQNVLPSLSVDAFMKMKKFSCEETAFPKEAPIGKQTGRRKMCIPLKKIMADDQ